MKIDRFKKYDFTKTHILLSRGRSTLHPKKCNQTVKYHLPTGSRYVTYILWDLKVKNEADRTLKSLGRELSLYHGSIIYPQAPV
jgi:hypothetical protein